MDMSTLLEQWKWGLFSSGIIGMIGHEVLRNKVKRQDSNHQDVTTVKHANSLYRHKQREV